MFFSLSLSLSLLVAGCVTTSNNKLYAIGINPKIDKIGQFKRATSKRWDASWNLVPGKVTFDVANKTWNTRIGDTDHIEAILPADDTIDFEPGKTITSIEFSTNNVTVTFSDGSTKHTTTYLAVRPRYLKDGRCVVRLTESKKIGKSWKRLWRKSYLVE